MKKLNRELLKVKSTNIYSYSIYAAILLTAILVFKDVFMSESVRNIGIDKWIRSNILIGNFILIHIISVAFLTLIIQREYSNNIIQNILPYLNRKSSFILGKLGIWFSLHFIITLLSFLITLVGGLLIFKNLDTISYINSLGIIYFKALILGYAILLPNLLVCIIQKKSFIISLISGGITIILSVGFLQANNILPYLLPWSSAFILIFNENNPFMFWEIISILIMATLSLFLSFYFLKKQEF